MPTNMMKTFVTIPTTAYQYIGQNGALPPTHITFGNPYNFGGRFINLQQSKIQPNQDLAQQLHEVQNFVHNMNNKGVKDFSF